MNIQYQQIRSQWKKVKKQEENPEFDYCEIHGLDFPINLDCPKCKCSL